MQVIEDGKMGSLIRMIKKFYLFIFQNVGTKFPKPSVGTYKGRTIYDVAENLGQTYKAGDYVMAQDNICQVVYFYEKNGKTRAHLKVFNHAENTLLTDTADPHEIVDVNECSNVKISSIEVIFSAACVGTGQL